MTHHGVDLYDRGYDKLVLIRQGSKAPAFSGWMHNPPTREQVKEWPGNIGILARDFPAIDIDLHDPELADKVMKWALDVFGRAPLRLSPKPASRLLVYRAALPFPKKVLTLPDEQGAVEILGSGRQYLVDGSHPDYPGQRWTWPKSPLWGIDPDRLSVVHEDDIDLWLDALQAEYGGFVGQGGRHEGEVRPAEELLAPDETKALELVRSLPNNDEFLAQAFPNQPGPRDTWVAMGHAIKGALGEAGEKAFLEYTSRWEDGPVDLEDARVVYAGLNPERYGWATLSRIAGLVSRGEPQDYFTAKPRPPEESEDEVVPVALYFTDEYLADYLTPVLRNTLRFAESHWYVWTGTHWKVDDKKDALRVEGRVRRELRRVADKMLQQAFNAPNKDEMKAIMKRARQISNRAGQVTLMQHLRVPLMTPIDEFDSDPMIFNTPDGLVDLATGEMRPTTPDDRVTRIGGVGPAAEYDPAQAPRWSAFMEHLTEGDVELERFLARYVGYCLTGHMTEKSFLFVWGRHDTGKTQFINVVQHLLGDYAQYENPDFLLGKVSSDHKKQAFARLFGARLLVTSEPGAGRQWDDEIVKQITGREQATARYLYQGAFQYYPDFKIMVSGNFEPELRVVDLALLRRILIAPMNNPVPESEQIGDYANILFEEEGPQIMRWAINGCIDWQEQGLNPPTAVQEVTEEYREEEDIFMQWVEENCEIGSDFQETTQMLFNDWARWCQQRHRSPGSYVHFARSVVSRAPTLNIERFRSNTERGFRGIRVKPKKRLGTDLKQEG